MPGGVPGMVIGGMAGGLGRGTVGLHGAYVGPGDRGGAGSRQPVTMRRGMPSGTVIGAQSSTGTPGTRGAVGGMMPAQAGRPGDEKDGSTTPTGTPDQIWGIESGVASVIAPVSEHAEHDPGPGVIGRDR
jgi:hypothetical protein